tara:strand:- start:1155 stop:1484 length:330 start_codon:yes stop_codon:yes gene_type:complete
MAGYDPQSRRPRPSLPTDIPVDGLLDAEVGKADVLSGNSIGGGDPAEEMPTDSGRTASEGSDSGLQPFEAPPIEMTDERADLLHRLGLLAAVAALVAVLMLWRRRRRDG